MPVTIALYPGSLKAGDTLKLPPWAPPIRYLLKFIRKRKNSITWDLAAGTIATDDVSASGSGSDVMCETEEWIITTSTPSGKEVQVTGDRDIVVGDTIDDGDLVIVTYIAKGEFSGV